MVSDNCNKFFKKNKLFFYGITFALLLAFLDLFSKELVFHILQTKSEIRSQQFIEVTSFFNLVKVWNTGVSFGMFSQLEHRKIIFSVIVSLISLIMIIWLYRSREKHLIIAISLILGGAIGNLTDRMINSAVADFLDFHLFEYHWPAFNLADSYVFIGVVIIIFEDLFIKKNKNV